MSQSFLIHFLFIVGNEYAFDDDELPWRWQCAFVGLHGYYKTSKEDAWRAMYCTGLTSSDRQMHSAGFNDHDIWLCSSSCGLIPLLILHTAVDDAVAFSYPSSSDGCT